MNKKPPKWAENILKRARIWTSRRPASGYSLKTYIPACTLHFEVCIPGLTKMHGEYLVALPRVSVPASLHRKNAELSISLIFLTVTHKRIVLILILLNA